MNVRLIAVAEGIDTAKGEDDFMPFRNILAEWHASLCLVIVPRKQSGD